MYRWHWHTFQVWARAWRRWIWRPAGLAGAERMGLDMVQVNALMTGMGIPPADWPAIHDGLMVMEAEALAALDETKG